MAINQQGQQDKLSNKIDRESKKLKKEIPLMERDFRDLLTLADQFEYIRLKQAQKDKLDTQEAKPLSYI
jgi:hypothetical protein